MTKFLAIVKREYLQRVRSRMFALMTVLGPVMLVVFTIVPGLLMSMKTGGDTRLAIVDQTGQLYESVRDSILQRQVNNDQNLGEQIEQQVNANTTERLKDAGKAISGGFSIERVDVEGKSIESIKETLNARVARSELDGYLVLPPDILTNNQSKPSYFGRNGGDLVTTGQLQGRLDRAIRRQRLIASGVKESEVETLSKQVALDAYSVSEKGVEGAQGSAIARFMLVFIIAFLIYLTVLLYGQVVLGAVVEEKETRIAEILFSSVRSFQLMFGKLIGVSLVALTQLAIWGLVFFGVSVWGVATLASKGFEGVTFPSLPPLFFLYFVLFFMLGYFIYSTIYVLIGSMVTTAQEGGQLAMPVVFLLMSGLYLAFVVIRNPDSPFAFWISMVPFFSPITMVVRIVSSTPPLWQILLSLGIGVLTVVLLLWLASRIYRIGMLMYGKRATIPEVMRWVRQQ